ncbi:MAG: DUF4190 domain-containing protein [Casimicrobiaceae bacterium]
MSYQPYSRPASSTSSLAVVSLVFGILAWCLLPFVGAIVAIICGHMARSEIRKAAPDAAIEGDGLAIAGLVLGYAHLALAVLAMFVVIVAVSFGFALFGWH